MPDYNGIEVGKKLKKILPNVIIVFVTSYPQYAIQAYDCEAFHYVLKPCTEEKIFDILQKIVLKYNSTHRYHIVKVKNRDCKILISDIYYIECCRKHIIYHLKDRKIETVDKLSSVYSDLKDFGFYKIHQGYIVNFDKVCEFENHDVILEDGRKVAISIRKNKEVILAFAKYAERFL